MGNIKDIFGFEDTRSEHEKQLNDELDKCLNEYEKRFNEQLNTECFSIDDEQFIKDLKRCLEEGIRLDAIYPGINNLDEDCDY